MTRSEPIRACFLDIDGVILDPALTPLEWRRLEGEILAPALGGTVADWGRAAAVVVPRLFGAGGLAWVYDDDPVISERLVGTRVVREMCAELQLAPPSDEAAATLAREIELHVYSNIRAAFPDAVEAIRRLARLTTLHTATGNHSWRLEPLLTQLGVREHFGFLSGPDLVGTHKHTQAFYPRTFEAAGVAAAQALVVDDDALRLAVAASFGARTVLVGGGTPLEGVDHVVGSLSELPALLEALARR